jgi:hypothetical protein
LNQPELTFPAPDVGLTLGRVLILY